MKTEHSFRFADGPLAGLSIHVEVKLDPGGFTEPYYSVFVQAPMDDLAHQTNDDHRWYASYRFQGWSYDFAVLRQKPRAPHDDPDMTELMLVRPGNLVAVSDNQELVGDGH